MRISLQMLTYSAAKNLDGRMTGERPGPPVTAATAPGDPARSAAALRLRAALSARQQEATNAVEGLAWVESSEGLLRSAVQQLLLVSDLAERVAGDENSADRLSVRRQVAAVRDSLLTTANSRHCQRPLFAGFALRDAVAFVDGNWAYVGDSGRITRRVSPANAVAINVTGDEIFGFAAGVNVFRMLDCLFDALSVEGNASVRQSVSDVRSALERLDRGLSALENAADRLGESLAQNLNEQKRLSRNLREIDDSHAPEILGELQTQSIVHQASLESLSKALQPSLMDFLR